MESLRQIRGFLIAGRSKRRCHLWRGLVDNRFCKPQHCALLMRGLCIIKMSAEDVGFGHSRGYFCSLRSKNISLARPPLASPIYRFATNGSPDARFESPILSLAQTKTTLFALFLVLAEDVGFEPTKLFLVWRFSKPLPSATRPILQYIHFVQIVALRED